MKRKRGVAAKCTMVAQVCACVRVCVSNLLHARLPRAACPPASLALRRDTYQTHMSLGITWQHAYFRVALDLGKKPSAVIEPRLVKVAMYAARAHSVCSKCAAGWKACGRGSIAGCTRMSLLGAANFCHGHALDGTTWCGCVPPEGRMLVCVCTSNLLKCDRGGLGCRVSSCRVYTRSTAT